MSLLRKSPSRLLFIFMMIATLVGAPGFAEARDWWLPPWDEDEEDDGCAGDPTTGSKLAPIFIPLGLPNISCAVSGILGSIWGEEVIVILPTTMTTVSAAPKVSVPPVIIQMRPAGK